MKIIIIHKVEAMKIPVAKLLRDNDNDSTHEQMES